MNISVNPIFSLSEQRHREDALVQIRQNVDSKICNIVFKRIHRETTRKSNKLGKVSVGKGKKPPIGLRPVDPGGWLNALMQFILFVPTFTGLFFFAPRSFSPFQEFIDQYQQDQQENRTLSSANGLILFRFLSSKLTHMSMTEIFDFLISSLNANWKIHSTMDEALCGGNPNDFFVTENLKKKQLFKFPERYCYDLDAFIEVRPDGPAATFFTYVKVEGIWYQCDDDRITQLRSDRLDIPLKRGVLFHYQRVV